MAESEEGVGRSERFIVTFQLESVCSALRLLVQTKEGPNKQIVTLLNRLQADVTKILRGAPVLQAVPQISDQSSIGEMLVLAEVLRGTMLAFLAPEEVKDITKSRVGFFGST